jgi:hypothetical protein
VDFTRLLTDERLLADLESEVRPLVAAVWTALGELIAPGGESALRFLDAAPAEECVRLAGAWAGARAIGLDTDAVKARFSPEEQLVIEIVAAVYAPPPPGSADLPALGSLLDEPPITPPPVART